jgi:galactokinase
MRPLGSGKRDAVRMRAHAPGRVNLIGDHTDYAGGLAMPMAIDLGTTILGETHGDRIVLRSKQADEPAALPLTVAQPEAIEPSWARYVAGVVAELSPDRGFIGVVDSTVPLGSGLASSAALEIAVALALGYEGTAKDLALLCQRAEQRASGVPCGVMDQLASACGRADHAMLIDFAMLDIDYVVVPPAAEIVVVHSGESRELSESVYDDRRAQTEEAAAVVGPLRDLDVDQLSRIQDPVVRRRARHVVTENDRVQQFAEAFRRGDLESAGGLMLESHRSLRDDFEVSTGALDALVDRLVSSDGVFGARLTGAGFGGCVVALCAAGALPDEGWHVKASAGAHVAELA